MVLVWITFIWLSIMIVYYGMKWIKEKKKTKSFKTRMRNYDNPLGMSIGRRIKFKRGYRW